MSEYKAANIKRNISIKKKSDKKTFGLNFFDAKDAFTLNSSRRYRKYDFVQQVRVKKTHLQVPSKKSLFNSIL